MISGSILVVEEDAEVCNVIEEILENAGFSVVVCHTGTSALRGAEIHRQDYAAVIIGAKLPDGGGQDFFKSRTFLKE